MTITYFEFNSTVKITLNQIIKTIEQKNVLKEDYQLRVGSIFFEENLKNEINKKNEEIIKNVNELLKSIYYQLRLESITAELNETETSNRTYYDLLLNFKDKDSDELIQVPVNIKITLGKSKDNVCGWQGLASALYLNITLDNIKKKEFYQLVKNNKMKDDIMDYFIWSFNKNDGSELLNNHKCLSLLTINKDDMSININQAMPLQINTRTCKLLKNIDLLNERKLLVSKILKGILDSYNQETILLKEALNNVH